MPSPFAVTAPTNTILLQDGHGEACVTVENVSGRPIRGRASLAFDTPAVKEWLTLAEPTERDYPTAGVEQYAVRITAPRGAPAGSYIFRLDMVGVESPDELYSEDPSITFEIPASPVPIRFPWWIAAAAGAVVLAVVLAIVLWPRDVKVPAVQGLTIDKARAELSRVRLQVSGQTEVSDEHIRKDLVVGSEPPAGREVKRGSGVDLIVSTGPLPTPTPSPTPPPTAAPARLEIISLQLSPTDAVARLAPVVLRVTFKNAGSRTSDEVEARWEPYRNCPDSLLKKAVVRPMGAGQAVTVSFAGHTYAEGGQYESRVSLSSGGTPLWVTVNVRPPIMTLDPRTSYQVNGGGGNGGGWHDVRCQPGMVVTSIDGYTDQFISQVRISCAPLEEDGTPDRSRTDPRTALGTAKGSYYRLDCQGDLVLTGIRGRSGTLVDSIEGRCASLIDPPRIIFTGAKGGPGGANALSALCPEGWAVTGVAGNFGLVVDQINIICTKVVQR